MSARRKHTDERRRTTLAGALAAAMLAGVLYIAFTALSGLPWQSRYEISVALPDAARLQKNDTVRIRGVRVGRVTGADVQPATASQRPYALVHLALDGDVHLPADTTAAARSASVLGASYIALTPGASPQTLRDGATIPLPKTAPKVELTDLFGLFDGSARKHIQTLTRELGTGLAGRGPALNDALAQLDRLLPPLTTVARVLAAPATNLAGFIRGTRDIATAFAPVRTQFAALITDAADTFESLAQQRASLDRTVAILPEAEGSLTTALNRVAPSLDRLAGIATDLRPAVVRLPRTLTAVNRMLDDGAPVLRRSPAFFGRLQTTFDALAAVSRAPTTGQSVRRLADVASALLPTIQVLEAAQVHCNAMSVLMDNVFSLGGFPLVGGQTGQPPIYAANLYVSHVGAEGEGQQQPAPSSNVGINYLPHENAQECESGNELHDGVRQMLGNPPGLQSTAHPTTVPYPGTTDHARGAGLLNKPEGWQP